ncbi:MAG TPA: sigma-54 dependent transcriptional regulator [Polyangiaceae bacterium]|nr:sigma-54 dependent transcriptional regulator [Polyangiaceae bacterium]
MTFTGPMSDSMTEARSEDRLISTPTRVLLVDDDRVFARSLARSLRALGFTVEVTYDGADAMQLMSNRTFDAVVLDLEMHPVDGWQVLDVHSRLKDPPAAVILSGHLDVPRTVRALRAGVADAYQKPIDTLELASGLREAILKHNGSTPSLQPEPDVGVDAASRILGHTAALQVVRSQLRRVARYRDLPVMIVGEPGCEQEQVARALHELDENAGPFEAIDCALTPPDELERAIFGMAPGPFSSTRDAHPGILERAHGGTLFFDNVSETNSTLQARLLNVLETRRYRKVSGNEERIFQARVVSATCRTIEHGRIEGMRPDLYYRLAGITVVLPPLRARMDDIAPLVEHYSELLAPSGRVVKFSARALQALQQHDWPGNLRELSQVVQTAILLGGRERIGTKHVRAALAASSLDRTTEPPLRPDHAARESSLPTVERALIVDAFEAASRNISEAARQLGIPRSTLRDRLRRLGML